VSSVAKNFKLGVKVLKESENPPVSWPQGTSIDRFSGTWWVAHTKSRNEKALAQDLIAKDICYFLPMHWRKSRRSGRVIKSFLPLFSSYLFFCGDERQRLELLRTNRVAGLIEVKDQKKLLDELQKIEQAIRTGLVISPHKYIRQGQLCRVLTGPLAGMEGVVLKGQTVTRLVLQVDMLGQAASVEIDRDIIEVVEE